MENRKWTENKDDHKQENDVKGEIEQTIRNIRKGTNWWTACSHVCKNITTKKLKKNVDLVWSWKKKNEKNIK